MHNTVARDSHSLPARSVWPLCLQQRSTTRNNTLVKSTDGEAAAVVAVSVPAQSPKAQGVGAGLPPPASDVYGIPAALQTRYEQAYSMSQLYAAERPPPIPLDEHERRRRVKDVQEVVDAGRRKGVSEERVRGGLAALEALLPGVLSLHRMKPADWAAVAADPGAAAEKIIILKSLYPAVDVFKIIFRRPRLLLTPGARLQQDAAAVTRLLSSSPNPAIILEASPDLTCPLSLARALASLAAAFPGQDPVGLLSRHPDVLSNLDEASVELTADYGELSTKD